MLKKKDGTPDFRQSVNESFLPNAFTDEIEATFAELIVGHSLNIPILSLIVNIPVEETDVQSNWTPILFKPE